LSIWLYIQFFFENANRVEPKIDTSYY
jgi:hypothetical protein